MMDYLISSPDPAPPLRGEGPTVNGVVINVGSGSPAASAGSPAKKAVKKVRREASFRQLFHSKSTKAPVPYNAPPQNGNVGNLSPYYNGNNNTPSPVMQSSAQPQPTVKKTFSVASPASSSTANIINAGVAINGETYKSLGDVFGINAAVNNLITEQHVRSQDKPKLSKNPSLPLNGHMSNGLRPTPTATPTGFTVRNGDTAVYRVNSAAVRTHAHNRNSTYSNVSVGSRFGSQESRASYNGGNPGVRGFYDSQGSSGDPYKSNSSLDLDSEVDIVQQAVAGASFFGANLHHGHHDGLRSFDPMGQGEPAAMSTLQRKPAVNGQAVNGGNTVLAELDSASSNSSPKLAKKKGFFSTSKDEKSQKSLFKKLGRSLDKTTKSTDDSSVLSGNSSGHSLEQLRSSGQRQQTVDDRHRRRFFSHHDVYSMCATLRGDSALKTASSHSNTGASAACAALKGGLTNSSDQDHGDNVSNDLVLR